MQVTEVNDLPEGEHFAILVFSTRNYPDPYATGRVDISESVVEYIVYDTKDEWLAAIKEYTLRKNSYSNETWAPVVVKRAKVITTVTVDVEA